MSRSCNMRLRAWLSGLMLLVIAINHTSVAAEQSYSMNDLRALAEQGAWSELAAHLEDIRPSERGPEWNTVLEQGALGLLEPAAQAENAYTGLWTSEGLLGRYPKLKSVQAFMAKRAEVGLEAFGVCFQDNYAADQCLQDMTKFVRNDPNNLDLAFKAGKLARRNLKHWAAAPFFVSALAEPGGERRCDDADVALAVIAGLSLPSEGYEPHYGASVKLASQLCWMELKPGLAQHIAAEGEYFRENTCGVFKSKNALTGEVANVCRKYQK